MNIEELLQKLEQKEIFLAVQGTQLVKKAARPIPAGIDNTIRVYERQLIQHLQKEQRRPIADAPPEPTAPKTPDDICTGLLDNPPTRTEAVERLVATFRPEIHDAQRERWQTTTLSGKPVADAPENYLLAEAVGLTAWAQEREVRGLYNRGAYAWITTALQLVERRGTRPKAA